MFRFLPGGGPKTNQHWRPAGSYSIAVVGESHYQSNLLYVVGGKTEEGANFECEAILIPEPNNLYDNNAVRVEIAGKVVGYLSKDDNKRYLRALKESGSRKRAVAAKALITGGWFRQNEYGDVDQGHFGVKLDMCWPPQLDE